MKKSYGWAIGLYRKKKLIDASYFFSRKEARMVLKSHKSALADVIKKGQYSIKVYRVFHEEVEI